MRSASDRSEPRRGQGEEALNTSVHAQNSGGAGSGSSLDFPSLFRILGPMPLTQSVLTELAAIIAPDKILTSLEDLIPYSFDGTAALQEMPGCVVFARNA